MSIIWEGMKAQPTFSRPSPALSASYCIIAGLYTPRQEKLRQMGRLIGMGIGHSTAWLPTPPFTFHICQSAYCKTTVARLGFLPWNPFYATLRTCLCAPSHRTCVLCWKDMIRAMAFRVAGTSNWETLCTTYCTSQNITTDTPQSY